MREAGEGIPRTDVGPTLPPEEPPRPWDGGTGPSLSDWNSAARTPTPTRAALSRYGQLGHNQDPAPRGAAGCES